MLNIQFTPFPVLRTQRLTLRQLTAADAPIIQFFRSDADFLRYIPRPKEPTLEQAHQHLRLLEDLRIGNEGVTWGLSRDGEPGLLGIICLWNLEPAHHRAEVGYGLRPEFTKQGYMSEALAAVIDYSFTQLRLHSLEAQVDPANAASIQLLEKHGFVREAYFREKYCFQGRFLDSAVYSCLAPQRAAGSSALAPA
ncbi:GNAT family N-acetyltransferase [Hymenobacter metallicola]|uniref:N-acetyltransferase n=1 Tax=Hymenobacter metallicola TaxID=2563114 RepID=A0A4Z0QEU7_9BACT|nr:GNAT family N-acetyltransferase [Hymenobacter metallicola]TGE27723.1 N-acetyltransferase [Hymenobacter metallicola]